MAVAPVVLYWHRMDLRLADNPALHAAAAMGAVQPVFILDDANGDPWTYGGASRWWLHHSLAALQASYRQRGIKLLIRRGRPDDIIPQLAQDLNATHVMWNRRYEPRHIAQDTAIKTILSAGGIETKSFNGHLLVEPWDVQTKAGTPFKVFTPFWRNVSARAPQFDPLLPAPETLSSVKHPVAGAALADLHLLPSKPDWTQSFQGVWHVGEDGAAKQLELFCGDAAGLYKDGRDFPARDATSRLSPHLAFGEISPRQIWSAVQQALNDPEFNGAGRMGAEAFLRQIGWREFSYHLLYHFPQTPSEPLYPQFRDFPWVYRSDFWKAWTTGQTGYPIVDAGMRQLWQTGWMHNRIRLVTASFLIKDLNIAWQEGAKWFWDTLVDADLANNTMGWQWVAGCGADASPYDRVFNPTLQSVKFDPDAAYIRQFVPEIAALPDKYIHNPHAAPAAILEQAGIVPGTHYPAPIVDHALARDHALSLLKAFKYKNRNGSV